MAKLNEGWQDVSHELKQPISDDWQDVSHELKNQKQPDFTDPSLYEGLLRSGLEGATAGLSEPVISGIQAGIQNTKHSIEDAKNIPDFFDKITDVDRYKNEFNNDVERRRLQKAKDPSLNLTAELGGAVFPSPLNLGSKLYKGIDEGLEGIKALNGTGYLSKIAKGATEGALGGLGYESSKQIAERPVGFIQDGSTSDDLKKAALWGTGIGGGISAVFNAPNALVNTGKKLLTTKLGVPQENINEYLKRPDDINSAPTTEQLRDQIFDVVKDISDKYQNAKINSNEAATAYNNLRDKLALQLQNEKLNAKEAFKEAQRIVDSQIIKSRNEAASDIVSSLSDLKNRISEGSSDSYNILDKDKNAYSVRGAGKVLRKLADEMNIQPAAKFTPENQVDGIIPRVNFGEVLPQASGPVTSETQAIQNKLLDFANRLESTPERVSASTLKQIMQELDNSGKASYGQPGFDSRISQAYKMIRGVIDDTVKAQNPEYAVKMKEVAENSNLFNKATNAFGTEPQALSFLNTVDGPLSKPKMDLLKQYQEKIGKDYLTHISPQNQNAYLDLLTKQQAYNEMQKPGFMDSMIDERSSISPEKFWMDKKASDLSQAENQYLPFKSISPNSAGQTTIQSKINTVMRDSNIETKRMFEDLSKLSNTDFVKTINDMRIKQGFEKGFQNGSSNVNFWATLGGTLGSVFGFHGAAMGATAGAGLGKYLDKYGPSVAKSILDGVLQMKGNPTFDAIAKFNIPPEAKNELARDLFIYESQSTPKNVKVDSPKTGYLEDRNKQLNKNDFSSIEKPDPQSDWDKAVEYMKQKYDKTHK